MLDNIISQIKNLNIGSSEELANMSDTELTSHIQKLKDIQQSLSMENVRLQESIRNKQTQIEAVKAEIEKKYGTSELSQLESKERELSAELLKSMESMQKYIGEINAHI